VGDEKPQVVSKMNVLGSTFDHNLDFEPMLAEVLGSTHSGSARLFTQLRDLSIGVAQQVQQLPMRVLASTFHGAEPLASAAAGWASVAKRLDGLHYTVMKMTLGAEGCSLGAGGRHRLMMILGVELRLSTAMAIRIVLARARLLSLPPGNPVEAAISGAEHSTGRTWLSDAVEVMRGMGIHEDQDFLRTPAALQHLMVRTPESRQKAVLIWKRLIVMPAAKGLDRRWIAGQIGQSTPLPWEIHIQDELLPGALRYVHLTKGTWFQVRIWAAARASGSIPWAAMGRSDLSNVSACPFCDESLDLQHIVHSCSHFPGTEPWPSQFERHADLNVTLDRIRWVGRRHLQWLRALS